MSFDISPTHLRALQGSVEAVLELSRQIEEAQTELVYLSKRLNHLISEYPIFHPSNSDHLQLCDIRRGGCLYKPGRRYLRWKNRHTELTADVCRLSYARTEHIEWERAMRRAILERAEADAREREAVEKRNIG